MAKGKSIKLYLKRIITNDDIANTNVSYVFKPVESDIRSNLTLKISGSNSRAKEVLSMFNLPEVKQSGIDLVVDKRTEQVQLEDGTDEEKDEKLEESD